jgi:YVTN family beta-propeller protein
VALAAGRAFVTNQYAASMSVIDLASLTVERTLPVGEYPEGIAASADGTALYVACWFDNVLQRFDTKTLAATGEADVGDGPRAFGLFLR